MSRYLAAFYHLLISLVVFCFLAYLVVFVWYPEFFYSIDGGWEGMRIIIAVDLVLGPTLTLVVFKAGKPGLKFDLTLIGLLQSTCLLAGLYIVYLERPIFFVYYEKYFYSSSADTFKRYEMPVPDPYQFADKLPARVISILPPGPIEAADTLLDLYRGGTPTWTDANTYEQLDLHLQSIIEYGIAEAKIRARDGAGNLDKWLSKQGGSFSDYAFFPIHSRYRDAFLGIRKQDLKLMGIVEIPPPM